MPDEIPRDARHFVSSVLPIPHQSGLCLSQPTWQCHTWFLGRNVHPSERTLVVLSWGWSWDDQLSDTGKICWNCGAVIEQTQKLAQKTSNMVGCRAVLRFGVHRGKTLGLVPITVVSSLSGLMIA